MTAKFYLTTTLPYVNAAPHIGHALEFFQADAIVRYHRRKLGKENVYFNVGTDEHGLKIYQKAEESGLTPQEYADQNAQKWIEFCKLFAIDFDFFYRTSADYHLEPAQKFWRASQEKGDIYKKRYEGLYCVGCEAFKTEKELVDGKCPDHNAVPIQYAEENYFFKLSKYREELLNFYKEHRDILKPESKFAELENFLKNLEDISISRIRENLPWGIPVPDDDTQVMYVWFDALTNYAASVGYGSDEERFTTWWPPVQLFGPDNLRFQCAIWQGMLLSAGLPPTKKFLCHGTVLGPDGHKMSKTIGNVVSPFDQLEKFGPDIVRYYMLALLPTYGDSAYSEQDLVFNYNANLANNFGNLLNRIIHLANEKKVKINNFNKVEEDFKREVDTFESKINNYYEEFELKQAADLISELSDWGNKYVDQEKPWQSDASTRVEVVLNNLSYLLSKVIDAYEPIIPTSSARAKEALANRSKIILFPRLDLKI